MLNWSIVFSCGQFLDNFLKSFANSLHFLSQIFQLYLTRIVKINTYEDVLVSVFKWKVTFTVVHEQNRSVHNKKKLTLTNLPSSKVHGWSLWLTKILDLVPIFSKVHGWSLWFALCDAFSPQLTNLKVSASRSYGLNALQSANHRDHSCTFGKSWGLNALQSANHRTIRVLLES
ncbi:hypothetical protein Hanom_Chr03g00191721 [Helianthus anomalus]